jgi:formylglycine-generating enzyme required for sulfatase activity
MTSLFRPSLLPAITALALLAATGIHANDIQVTNPTLTGTNTVNATTQVQFDITWANSWRTSSAPNNWDAAWVFVKYRDANTDLWQHAQLGSDAQHSAPAGSTVATGLLTPGTAYNAATNWGVGAFIHRSADGTGTFAANGTQLRWNYGQNGITYADIAEVRVFAVEMVYVPQGSFSVGDGLSSLSVERFIGSEIGGTYRVTSEAAIVVGLLPGLSCWQCNLNLSLVTGILPAAYPKGFAGFYVMKYEITQQQYVDFLNSLTRIQQNTRTAVDISGTAITNRYVMANSVLAAGRNGIRCDATIPASPAPVTFYCDLNGNGTGGDANDGQGIACNGLRWWHLMAYLHWSGLRPMTELEYEKACRGPVAPVSNEYAWGSTSVTGVGNISNAGAINESSNTAGANAVFQSSVGPMRVGAFATASTTRVQSGASYYGIMELSGNLWESTVRTRRDMTYTGIHGNGALTATGDAVAASGWPLSLSGASATGPLNSTTRGGSTNTPPLSISDRLLNTQSGGMGIEGGRGLRSFP